MLKTPPRNAPALREQRRLDLAYAQLATSEIARDINSDIVLELLRMHQPISRADLARISGLQRSTVSLIVDRLIVQRWAREGAVRERPRGRRPTMLELNDELVMVAVDMRPQHATVAVVDLNGQLLERKRVALGIDPRLSLQQVTKAIAELRRQFRHKSFEGVGVSLPGRVDPGSRRLIFSPNLAWPEYDICGALEKGCRLPVEMDNAANACLLAESWFGRMDGVRNAVLVTVAEGIGTSILANGQLVHGSHGMAGEFGHVSLDPAGPQCRCGRRGCWEVYASSNAALGYYAESAGHRLPSVQQLLALADAGDAAALQALERQMDGIARGLQVICTALAPERLLITGDIIGAWPRFAQRMQARLSSLTMGGPAPQILPTEEAESGRLRGAAVLAFRRRSRHAIEG